jgi:hypothetical protein
VESLGPPAFLGRPDMDQPSCRVEVNHYLRSMLVAQFAQRALDFNRAIFDFYFHIWWHRDRFLPYSRHCFDPLNLGFPQVLFLDSLPVPLAGEFEFVPVGNTFRINRTCETLKAFTSMVQVLE